MRLHHRPTTCPNSRSGIHILEAEIAGIEAVVPGNFLDFRVMVISEDDIGTLRASQQVYRDGHRMGLQGEIH